MIARDVMTSPVITVLENLPVKDVAKILLEKRVSAVVVTNLRGDICGIVSEGDLMRRFEAGTEQPKRGWLRWLSGGESAVEFRKTHGQRVSDVMTKDVVTAGPETPLHEIAKLMEKENIKRVPIAQNGQLVGIISRANLIQAVAAYTKPLQIEMSDRNIRDHLLAVLKTKSWASTGLLNVTVNNGVVDLWGMANSVEGREAIRVAAENVVGVLAVTNNMTVYSPSIASA